jgi:hypothetical protein
VTRLRDDADDFAGAIDNAARELRLAAEFVEKDYWVTQALRALHRCYAGWFVLKGGTSLAKGYNLIERFSEDVDVLVSPAKGDSAKSRERLLLAVVEGVATEMGVTWTPARDPGRGTSAHRADVLVYPRLPRRGTIVVPIEDRGVLLETGFAGGNWPSELVEITPILCEPLGIDPAEFEDTASFSVPALKPARTLLEKLSLLHHVAEEHQRSGSADARCGRHYYDVYRLLDHSPTREDLKDRKAFARIISEMEQISAQHFGTWKPRPDGGYGQSPAFAPTDGSDLARWLAARYRDSAGLLPAKVTGSWPSFGKVLKRVEKYRELCCRRFGRPPSTAPRAREGEPPTRSPTAGEAPSPARLASSC